MNEQSPLDGKSILVVDDEPDIIESVKEQLDICIVDSATDFDTALQYLRTYTYDAVVLDIMGVNGFELLREAVSRDFPAVMLTAHALSAESLKKSIKLGAVSFLPKDRITDLRMFLAEVVLGGGKPIWRKVFDKLGHFFDERFGPDWKEKDSFFREFQEELKKTS